MDGFYPAKLIFGICHKSVCRQISYTDAFQCLLGHSLLNSKNLRKVGESQSKNSGVLIYETTVSSIIMQHTGIANMQKPFSRVWGSFFRLQSSHRRSKLTRDEKFFAPVEKKHLARFT